MADLEKAGLYVAERGDPFDRARARALLYEEPPPTEVVTELRAAQAPEGGWPAAWSEGVPTLDETCFRLVQISDLGPGAPCDVRSGALAFVADRQRTDGTWEEDASLGDLTPPWRRRATRLPVFT
jgi:hypothetical protein